MIKFLDFLKETKEDWKHPDRSIEISSFAERRKGDWRHPDRSIEIPSFAEGRPRSLNENWIEDYDQKALEELNKALKIEHDFNQHLNHKDVTPTNLPIDHESSLKTFTKGSYAVNKYLSKTHRKESTNDYKPNDLDLVKYHIKTISSAFTPENTNRVPLTVYTGIQQKHALKLLEFSKRSHFNIPSFVSTSFSPLVAFDFAKDYDREEDSNDVYILKITVEPSAGLSISHISFHKQEQEVLLHHGVKMRYDGVEKEIEFKPNERLKRVYNLTILLATAFNEHIPLEHYGKI